MDYTYNLHKSGNLPYMNTINVHACHNQQEYFVEPRDVDHHLGDDILKETNLEKKIDEKLKIYYEAFGTMSHTYRRGQPGVDGQEFVFFRRDRGTMEYGLGRKDEGLYECSKFNILRHPQQYGSNSLDYEAVNTGKLQGYEKDMLRLTHYPRMVGAVMSAPLLPRRGPNVGPRSGKNVPIEGQFSMVMHGQPAAFTQVFKTPELCLIIMKHLGHRWGDLANLSRTCQFTLFAMNEVTFHVDETLGNFLNLQYSNDDIDKAIEKAGPDAIETFGCIARPKTVDFTIVSGIRGPYQPLSGEDELQDNGYPAAPRGRYLSPTFSSRVANTCRLLRTVDMRGPDLTVLHLHSTPNVNKSVLEMCLKSLPNLKSLGVYNCEQLDFGATVPFLRMVISHNEKPGNTRIRLDFAPYYYKGFQRKADGSGAEYGVTASDDGSINTRTAVTAILRTAVKLVWNTDIDWFSPGAAMRQYLERIPWALGSLRYILEALFGLESYERDVYHPVFNKATRERMSKLPPVDHTPLNKAMVRSLNNDLILALHGKAMEPKELDSILMSGSRVNLMRCAICSIKLPCLFFGSQYPDRIAGQRECDGCKLCRYLSAQVENYYQEKKHVVDILFDNPTAFPDIKTFLYSKRVVADLDLQDPLYPFWQASVKSPGEVLAASLANGTPLILDGRPSSTQADEMKEIWHCEDRLIKATRYAHDYIDRGFNITQPRMHAIRREIQQLDKQLAIGFNNPSLTTEHERIRELLRHDLEREYARGGDGQITSLWGATAAAEWGEEISKYRRHVQILAREMQNMVLQDATKDNARTE